MQLKIDEATRDRFRQTFLENNRIDPKYYNRYDVKRGLRNADGTGVLAGLTNICNVHGYVMNEGEKQNIEGELYYRGYNVKDIVAGIQGADRFGYEEVAYLLIMGKLPTSEELAGFQRLLAQNRELPSGFFEDMILKAPSKNIMNKISRSILALYSYEEGPEAKAPEDELYCALSIIAKMPVIMTSAYQVKRRAFDGGSMYMHQIRPEECTAETILSLLRPDRAYTYDEAKLLDLILLLHAEHGGGNNSTFACRVLTSSGTDPYSAYAAAVGSLKGPRHGGANLKVLEQLDYIEANVKHWNDDGEVADMLTKIVRKEASDRTGLIYGMGHAVYTLSDPRAVILKKTALQMAKGTEFEPQFSLLNSIERLAPEVFHRETGLEKALCANVDMYSGLCYRMLGIPEELATALFATARMAGWSAHRFEEKVTGGRIIRPAYKAVGKPKVYQDITER
ncbi:MAG: citrate synthase [Oscillospiraceae bacterium]|nr:citrate synthase [Oscillospiraceae bacterium]